jgi:hypothetical protein
MLDERREIDVVPGFVFSLAARHQNQAGQNARDLDDGMEELATAFAAGAHKQVVALVQELGKRVTGVHREWRQEREDLFPEIALGPGGALGIQSGHLVNPDAVLGQGRGDVVL